MDRSIVDQYEMDVEKVGLAIRGLTPEDLLSTPPADAKVGKWSIQQVVIHIADAEAAFADRIKRIIAEDEPVLLAWDENRFSERLSYEAQSAEDAAKLVELTRKQLARVLRKQPEAVFQRAGQHNQRGRQTLLDVLGAAVGHLEHHIRFIKAKREFMGKEVW